MSSNLNPGNPIAPLSIGNVVSAGTRLYSSHLKTYLRLSIFAHLWTLVPIYGWAKYAAISGLISRLAFRELIEQPESVTAARSQVNPRLWSFFRLSLRIGLLLILVYFGLAIVGGTLSFILALILGLVIGSTNSPTISFVLSFILTLIVVVIGVTWFYSRWAIAGVALAVEEGINISQSLDRSWELTKTAVLRVQGVILVAFVVTLPIVFLFNYLPQIFLLRTERGSTTYWIVYFISLLTSLTGGAFTMPFWQTINAVLYYDLRSRREGLGLRLRNPNL